MPLFSKKTVPIYGLVGLLRFTVEIDNEEDEDEFLYGFARKNHRELENEIRQEVELTLGADFEVVEVRLSQGSVSIMVILGATGTFYIGVSRYESFIKGVNLIVEHLKSIFRKFFERVNPGPPEIDISVSGSWQPTATVLSAREKLDAFSGFDYDLILLIYLLLSHAALLATFVWLLVHHLK